ncbi:MAG TPA: hypothetical protein PLY45_00220, partial [bacterium]|nr:hypothetical protein [bacterium]
MTAILCAAPALGAAEKEPARSQTQEIEELQRRVEALEAKKEVDDKQEEKISSAISRIDEIEGGLLKRETGRQIKILDEFMISAFGTFIIQGAHNTNAASRDDSNVVDPSFSGDLTFEKTFSKISGSSFLHLESGKG